MGRRLTRELEASGLSRSLPNISQNSCFENSCLEKGTGERYGSSREVHPAAQGRQVSLPAQEAHHRLGGGVVQGGAFGDGGVVFLTQGHLERGGCRRDPAAGGDAVSTALSSSRRFKCLALLEVSDSACSIILGKMQPSFKYCRQSVGDGQPGLSEGAAVRGRLEGRSEAHKPASSTGDDPPVTVTEGRNAAEKSGSHLVETRAVSLTAEADSHSSLIIQTGQLIVDMFRCEVPVELCSFCMLREKPGSELTTKHFTSQDIDKPAVRGGSRGDSSSSSSGSPQFGSRDREAELIIKALLRHSRLSINYLHPNVSTECRVDDTSRTLEDGHRRHGALSTPPARAPAVPEPSGVTGNCIYFVIITAFVSLVCKFMAQTRGADTSPLLVTQVEVLPPAPDPSRLTHGPMSKGNRQAGGESESWTAGLIDECWLPSGGRCRFCSRPSGGNGRWRLFKGGVDYFQTSTRRQRATETLLRIVAAASRAVPVSWDVLSIRAAGEVSDFKAAASSPL
ncbi:hypothetical protein EYF80_039263 [Liparis tanakae]|uniref:Uncharacterized protein n=1 Tax=Liparis tanakae TaxID=230148 RepID=A0A4Z2GCT3_9TELE|nr:hypothetical protein EYF80_039263 [Liparis tanakae]